MKPVPLHFRAANRSRQRDQFRHTRIAAVKTCVEAGNLGHARQPFHDRFNRRQIIRLMQRGKGDEMIKISQNLGRDHSWRCVPRTTMSDTVSHTQHA
jgi:hypothetical protein